MSYFKFLDAVEDTADFETSSFLLMFQLPADSTFVNGDFVNLVDLIRCNKYKLQYVGETSQNFDEKIQLA